MPGCTIFNILSLTICSSVSGQQYLMIQTGLIHVGQLQCNNWEEQLSYHQNEGENSLFVWLWMCMLPSQPIYCIRRGSPCPPCWRLVYGRRLQLQFKRKGKRIYGFADTHLMEIIRHCSSWRRGIHTELKTIGRTWNEADFWLEILGCIYCKLVSIPIKRPCGIWLKIPLPHS